LSNLMIPLDQDLEIQDAMAELKQAEDMFNNALNPYRIDEAGHRIAAANSRIQAIIYERRQMDVETLVGTPQKKQAVQA
jgi:hypothetical protein